MRHRNFLYIFLASLAFTAFLSTAAFGSGFYNRSTPGNLDYRKTRPVDQNYEQGKAIFKGRSSDAPKLKYCLEVNGERLPVKRKSVKSFKRGEVDDFESNLYNCDAPDKRIADELSRDQLLYVLYYLNKRYRLNLG